MEIDLYNTNAEKEGSISIDDSIYDWYQRVVVGIEWLDKVTSFIMEKGKEFPQDKLHISFYKLTKLMNETDNGVN